MSKYKKCPRCDLNWIPVEEELCEVCKAEMGKASSINLIEDDDDSSFDEERICPVCKVNYLADDEDVCPTCKLDQQNKKADKGEDEDEEWKEFVEDDDSTVLDEGDEISLSMLQEEEERDEDEEDESSEEPDDFDESITDFDEGDYDEDEDEDEEEDDEDI